MKMTRLVQCFLKKSVGEQGILKLTEAAAYNAEEDTCNEMLARWLPVREPASIAYDNARRLWQCLGKVPPTITLYALDLDMRFPVCAMFSKVQRLR